MTKSGARSGGNEDWHVIVGVTGKLGTALARKLLERCAGQVLGLSRSSPPKDLGPRFQHETFDLSDSEAHMRVSQRMGSTPGCLRSISFCQGLPLELAPISDASPTSLEREWRLYVADPLALLQALFPFLQASKSRIVLIGSQAVLTCPAQWGSYGLAKAAQSQLAHIIASEWERLGIQCSEIEARFMKSSLTAPLPDRLVRMILDRGDADHPSDVASKLSTLILSDPALA